MKFGCLLTVAVLSVTSTATATTLKTTALSDLAALSTGVVQGDVIATKTLTDAKNVPWTVVTLAVENVLAGEFSDSEFSFRMVGGPTKNGGTLILVGSPVIQIGDSIVIFYDPTGHCQVSGLELGVFWQRTNAQGQSRLVDFLGRAIASFSDQGPLFSGEVVPRPGSGASGINPTPEVPSATGLVVNPVDGSISVQPLSALSGGPPTSAPPPAADAATALDQLQAFSLLYVTQPKAILSTTDLTGADDLSPPSAAKGASE
jgi:hypothetical protein